MIWSPRTRPPNPACATLPQPFEGRGPRFGVVDETFSLPRLLNIAQEPSRIRPNLSLVAPILEAKTSEGDRACDHGSSSVRNR